MEAVGQSMFLRTPMATSFDVADASGENEVPLTFDFLSRRERMRSSVIRVGLLGELLFLHIERSQLRGFGYLIRMLL